MNLLHLLEILMQENKFLKFLGFMWNPLSWVMEAAAIMAIVLANGGVSRQQFQFMINYVFNNHLISLSLLFFHLSCCSLLMDFSFFLFVEWYFQGEGPDWQDFVGIICLLLINSTISFVEENNAGNAAAALMARLAPKTKVFYFVI